VLENASGLFNLFGRQNLACVFLASVLRNTKRFFGRLMCFDCVYGEGSYEEVRWGLLLRTGSNRALFASDFCHVKADTRTSLRLLLVIKASADEFFLLIDIGDWRFIDYFSLIIVRSGCYLYRHTPCFIIMN